MEVNRGIQGYVELELKYCERCGGLWLRRRGSAGVYCKPCHFIMAEYPSVRARRGRTGDSPRVLEAGIEVKELMAVCAEGGAA
jgi:hypothetical protein